VIRKMWRDASSSHRRPLPYAQQGAGQPETQASGAADLDAGDSEPPVSARPSSPTPGSPADGHAERVGG